MKTFRPACLLAAVAVACILPVAGVAYGASSRRVPLTLDFAGFHARAELTLPAGKGPFPAVLLVAGAGPGDMDFTVRDLAHRPVSRIMRTIADTLAAHGFAALRYNKRCVRAVHDFDRVCFRQLTQRDLAADAAAALAALRARSEVDGKRVFLYGWSEGTLVAGALAAKAHPAGIILQGPVFDPLATVIDWQVNDVLVPYLERFASDGQLDSAQVQAAVHGGAGLWLQRYLSALTSPTGRGVNPYLDANHDGKLSVKAEIAPMLAGFVVQSFGAPDTLLPPLKDDIAALAKAPVLILQGMHDGSVPPLEARKLAAALKHAKGRVTLKLYPGLGHTLGPSASPAAEGFAPISSEPLDDLVHWLHAQEKRMQPQSTRSPQR